MKVRNHEVFVLHANLCKVFSSASRLIIIDMLSKREMSVGEIAESLEITPTAASQHLRVLRDHHVVRTRKAGQTVYYTLENPRMIDACHIIRSILMDSLKQRGAIAKRIRADQLTRSD